MSAASHEAFGRYLRVLRERRGLSLDAVCELTRRSLESFDKGTLSRMERGQQTPSLFKLGPLCRVYEISAEALIERMELDQDVEALGSPKTDGKSYEELLTLGEKALVRDNRKWEAYAYFRDALPLAGAQHAVAAWGNLITAIRSLGKNRLALHELLELEASAGLNPVHHAYVHERISNCHRCLGDMRRAEEHATIAIERATALEEARILAFAYTARAQAAIDQELFRPAAEDLQQALRAYREADRQRRGLVQPNPGFESLVLLLLADCSLHLGNVAGARRLALAAKRSGLDNETPLSQASSELVLGRIDARDGNAKRAAERWRRAASIAARIDNRRLAFTAELELFRQACEVGDHPRARAVRRRLDRLAPWVPRHASVLAEFKRLRDQLAPAGRRRSKA